MVPHRKKQTAPSLNHDLCYPRCPMIVVFIFEERSMIMLLPAMAAVMAPMRAFSLSILNMNKKTRTSYPLQFPAPWKRAPTVGQAVSQQAESRRRVGREVPEANQIFAESGLPARCFVSSCPCMSRLRNVQPRLRRKAASCESS
ncbi:hypothetical protein V5799_017885 [Amblyomma americanum]|uniref:Uncharacterized protein n=1 Tax=Amblyomma americanum TaxID=6943 RepID=A0AAQ4F1X9_AMBAM